jgi:hypothetical protein
MKYLLYCFALFQLTACKSIIAKTKKVNQETIFASKVAAQNFFKEKEQIDPGKVYYLSQKSYVDFVMEIPNLKQPIYLGTYLNDTMCLKQSAYLLDAPGCLGRLEKEMKESLRAWQTKSYQLEKRLNLNNFLFVNLVSGQPLPPIQTFGKPVIVVLYSTKITKVYEDLYKTTKQLAIEHANETEVIFIDADLIYNLPENQIP